VSQQDDVEPREPRDMYARALEHMTEVLLTETDTSRLLDQLARITGETLSVDRSLIVDMRTKEGRAIILCEWLNPNVEITPTKGAYPTSIFSAGEAELRKSRRPLESHAAAPHPALVSDSSAALLHGQMAIQSLLLVPFDFGLSGYHFFAFHQVTRARPWQPRALEFLRVATRHVSLALMQNAMIAARAESERAMHEAQKADSVALFAGSVAHDFGNLLGIVMGAVSRAREALEPDAPFAASLHDAERAANEAAELAKQLLAYAGKAHRTASDVDFSALVGEMQDLLHAAVGSVRLSLSCDTGTCFVHGDAAQLRQIVMNFVLNAAEAVGNAPEGAIAVAVRRETPADASPAPSTVVLSPLPPREGERLPRVVLEVRDNGKGIDPDVQKRIFEPFYSTKTKISGRGRGLGLAAVSGIAKTHGAELRVESAVGKGTTFTMLLPATLPPTAAAEPSAERHSRTTRTMTAESNNAQCTILLIDDTDNMRKMSARLLHELGYRAFAENSGVAGVDTLRKHGHAVSAVLLDWSMPPPGGRETFQHLRELCPDLPIVIMSGYAESVAHDLLDGGRTTFLEKPFTRDELGAALRAVIGRA